jgi:hypothetical protein
MRIIRVFALLSCVLASTAFAGELSLSREEFIAVSEFKALKQNPKNAKVPDQKLKAQASKTAGLKPQDFDAALKKVDQYGDELSKKAEAILKQKLEASIIGKRLGTVVIDTSQAHVVVGVSWKQGNVLDLEDEAATVAGIVKEEVAFVSTLAVWATDAQDKKVFSAKIGHDPMQNINLGKIKDYAKSRYIKFFEEVKRGAEAQAADSK